MAAEQARDLRFGQARGREPSDLGGIETRWAATIPTLGFTSLDTFALALANAVPFDLGEDAAARTGWSNPDRWIAIALHQPRSLPFDHHATRHDFAPAIKTQP